MPNVIPDKYVRKALLTLLSGIGTPIFETMVPKSVDQIPAKRVILSSQTDAQHNTNKCGHNWTHTILLDIISENTQGYSNKETVEDILQAINTIVDNNADIACPPFTIYNTQVASVYDQELQTATLTINRKLVRYQFIMG